MKKGVIIASALILLGSGSAFAQWSGSLNADGAWNFKQSNNGNADFNLKFSGEKFYIGTNLNIGHNYLPSTQTTSILDAKKEESEYYKGESKDKNRYT